MNWNEVGGERAKGVTIYREGSSARPGAWTCGSTLSAASGVAGAIDYSAGSIGVSCVRSAAGANGDARTAPF